MTYLFCGYRDWAKRIYETLQQKHVLEFCDSPSTLNVLSPLNYQGVFFVGWSDIVDSLWIDNTECICLHPSMLPKYRGGSPIQNQIISGEKWSGVTLFKMNDGLDSGDIIKQISFSLHGSLNDIIGRIETLGVSMIDEVLTCENISYTPQDNSKATYCKRRSPSMSEIKLTDFENFTATELQNKIRCLQDPYPMSYIVCKNETKLFIKESEI